jgi:hypothetical protein
MGRRQRHPLGHQLLGEVETIVSHARRGGARRLDVDLAAGRLAIEIKIRDLGDQLLGLALDDRRILLHSRLRGAGRAFVFAHEVAHVLRRRRLFRSVRREDEEWFADWFARELVLPRHAARQRWTDVLLAAYHVDYATVALQLAALGEGPRLMRNGEQVLCRSCGTTHHIAGCECLRWRVDPSADRALPDVRELGLLKPAASTPPQLRIDGLASGAT